MSSRRAQHGQQGAKQAGSAGWQGGNLVLLTPATVRGKCANNYLARNPRAPQASELAAPASRLPAKAPLLLSLSVFAWPHAALGNVLRVWRCYCRCCRHRKREHVQCNCLRTRHGHVQRVHLQLDQPLVREQQCRHPALAGTVAARNPAAGRCERCARWHGCRGAACNRSRPALCLRDAADKVQDAAS